MRGSNLIYWDACIFVYHFSGRAPDRQIAEGIAERVREVEQGAAHILTSTLTRVELLDCSLTPRQQTALNQLFDTRHAQLAIVDQRVADLAHEIRDFHRREGYAVSTPDAIHLATAVHYGAQVFLTTDGHRGTKKRGGLLALDRRVGGHHPLRVEVPSAKAPRLPLESDKPIAPSRKRE